MASNTPAPAGGANSTAFASTSSQAPAQPPAAPLWDRGHGIYIQDRKEKCLFAKWVMLPSNIPITQRAVPYITLKPRPVLGEIITAEQEGRFSRFLERMDIKHAHLFDFGHGIYIQGSFECNLIFKWLALPENKHIAERVGRPIPRLSPAFVADLARSMTPERELETMDIRQAQRQLGCLRERMQEILKELKAEQEDVMGDFDAEDSKRMEREDRECTDAQKKARR